MKTEHEGAGSCHWGSRMAFVSGGIVFFGAGSNRGLYTGDMDVIIDCGADVEELTEFAAQIGKASRFRSQKIIRIEWPDGGVPELTRAEWLALIENLRGESLSGGKDTLHVMVCCVGGHGRTGTALAILAALTGTDGEDPVTFIRSHYCHRAVETKAQCRYIRAIAQLDPDDDSDLANFDRACEKPLR